MQQGLNKKDTEKKAITVEFAKCLKCLQQVHLKFDEPINSNAQANSLCNVLEAVFLHGLKPLGTKKWSTYLMGQNQNELPNLTYWDVAKKFTHRGVVSQLTHLGQITSEIGMCRAWVRVALNDGIMESYLDSMRVDTLSLQHYYETWAYLRDIEQPGILKAYLQGLSQFQFRLSYNSSVLNMWTTAPLILSGVYNSHTPPPVIATPGPSTASRTKKQTSPIKFTGKTPLRRDASIEAGYDASVYNFSSTPTTAGASAPIAAGIFTSENTAEIKKLASLNQPSPDASSSSQISCPDPPIDRRCLSDVSRNPDGSMSSQGSLGSFNTSDSKSFGDSMSPAAKGGGFRGEAAGHDNETRDGSVADTPDTSPEKDRAQGYDTDPDLWVSVRDTVKRVSSVEQEKNNVTSPMSDNGTTSMKGFKEDVGYVGMNVGDKHPVEDIEGVEQNQISRARNVFKDDSKVLSGTFEPLRMAVDTKILGLAAAESKATAAKSRIQGASKFGDVRDDERGSIYNESKKKVEDQSDTDKTAVKQGTRNYTQKPSNSHSRVVDDIREGARVVDEGAQVFSNRLGNKAGWSSQFDTNQADVVSQGSVSSRDSVDTSRERSYGSMLQTYEPSAGFQSTTTVQQLIENLPQSSHTPNIVTTAQELSPETPADYEFVSLFPSAEFAYADLKAYEAQLTILGQICNERGLDQQNFACNHCSRPIGLIYGNPRVCTYDGSYYCRDCHENDELVVPSRVIYNWDFSKYKVAKHNKIFLMEVEEHPLLNIEKLNSKLYEHVRELNDIKTLRTKLLYLKSYMFTCQMSVAEDWRKMVWPKEYLYDGIHLYSIMDLNQVPSGILAQNLRKIIKFAVRHVYECRLCSQKGFICELCHNPKVIYPFQIDSTYRCRRCKAVYHKSCKIDIRPCPKCQRRMERKSRLGESNSTLDYSFSPTVA